MAVGNSFVEPSDILRKLDPISSNRMAKPKYK